MNQAERDEIARRKYLARGPGDEATKQYILNKYLGGGGSSEDSKKKKKKKKEKTSIRRGNLGIVDEEDSGWKATATSEPMDVDTEEIPKTKEDIEIVNGGVFRGRTDNWQTIRQGEAAAATTTTVEEEEEEDEKPVLVTENMDEETINALGGTARARATLQAMKATATSATTTQRSDNGPKMSSGQKAGLLTSEELKQEAARAREAERQILEKLKGDTGQHAETVYRDETGRKIDPKIKRAEEAKKRREAIEREERRMEWGKGLVQRSEEEARKRMLEQEQNKPLARYADDEEYNQELKEQQRWNDPAAGFLTNRSKGSKGGFTRPKYKGPWKPNRFMIPPGYRWDGVDRSNGFEDQFLLRQNQLKARAVEAHAWSTEDM